MNPQRSYLQERIAHRRRRAIVGLAVAAALAAAGLWTLGSAERTVPDRLLAAASTR
jgi:hypothetical protein